MIALVAVTMLLFGKMWILGLWIWKTMECFKWALMGQYSRNMEDSGADVRLNCVGLMCQEVSMEKNFNMWLRDCFCFGEEPGCFLPLFEETA